MSSHLGWEPVVVQPLGGTLTTAMKLALADRYAGGDTIAVQEGIELGAADLVWLEGVKVGRAEGADLYDDATELIEAIRQHGTIRTRLVD